MTLVAAYEKRKDKELHKLKQRVYNTVDGKPNPPQLLAIKKPAHLPKNLFAKLPTTPAASQSAEGKYDYNLRKGRAGSTSASGAHGGQDSDSGGDFWASIRRFVMNEPPQSQAAPSTGAAAAVTSAAVAGGSSSQAIGGAGTHDGNDGLGAASTAPRGEGRRWHNVADGYESGETLDDDDDGAINDDDSLSFDPSQTRSKRPRLVLSASDDSDG